MYSRTFVAAGSVQDDAMSEDVVLVARTGVVDHRENQKGKIRL